MRRWTIVIPLVGTAFLPACTPTPPSGQPAAACTFAAVQGASGLTMNCTVAGPLPNSLIDPLNPGNAGCAPASFSLFGQTVTAPLTVIYGENGDDNDARVRLGTTLLPGTHSGSLAKATGFSCETTIPPVAAVSTTFAGQHTALVDKSRTPACVFQSRLDLTTYNLTIAAGLNIDASEATRASVRNNLARRLDLEMASAVNRLLQPGADITAAAFRNRAGRCTNDYQEFTGN
jgi:hypothetical protein